MGITMRTIRDLTLALITWAVLAPGIQAQGRAEVTISVDAAQPENLTSRPDGTVYFGSMATGTIYRAAPRSVQAEPWILPSTSGLTRVLGVLADDATNTLWVCQNATGGRDGAPEVGQTALRSFDLETGADRNSYPLPPGSGVCNDMTVASDGTVYVAESFRGRVHRLRPGATELDVWVTSDAFPVIDGIAVLDDGSVYANDFSSGGLFRIPVNADGSAGEVVRIETSIPLGQPDGLRRVGPRTLLQAEQQGRLSELTIEGDRAEVRVVQQGLPRAAAVTLVGDTALVLVDLTRAVAVPYRMFGGTGSPTRNSASEQEIIEMSRVKWQWMAARNVDALAGLFHEQARFVHMGGTWGTEREIEIIRSGSIRYKQADIYEVVVEMFDDDTAILWNRITLLAEVGGQEVSNPFTVTEVYRRQVGDWKLLALTFSSVRAGHAIEP